MVAVRTTSLKALWLLFVPPRLKRNGFCMYHRLESAVVAVCTTSFKAQWLLYVPPRVTFGSLIHISLAQYRRTCLWTSYDSRNSRVRQYIDPLVRVVNMFAVRRGPTYPTFLSQ
jgi:hypothetical protein